jgi:hypothetical protein
VVVDARRAVWLPEEQALIVADTHLGYAWVQRHRRQLVPLGVDDTNDRLASLLLDYPARTVVVLGDVVHAAVGQVPLGPILREFCQRLQASERKLVLVLGNHDRGLTDQLRRESLPILAVAEYALGDKILVHGDQAPETWESGKLILSGHEHPCVKLSDGVATHVKVPCFLRGPENLILPAFSSWAAGTVPRPGGFLGPIAARAGLVEAIACMGPRLLRMPHP